MRPATAPLPLTDGQREVLEALAKSRASPHREVTRARALLLAGVAALVPFARASVSASPGTRGGRVGDSVWGAGG